MRVLIVDDHALFRAGMSLLLKESSPDIEISEAGTLADGIEAAMSEPLNLVFLDLDLPDGYGLDALMSLKTHRPSLPVLVMSADESVETITRALAAHAMGFVPKSQKPDVLLAALRCALAGGIFLPSSVMTADTDALELARNAGRTTRLEQAVQRPKLMCREELGLTAREFETLRLLVRGLPTKSIAVQMGIEDITVRKYVSQLLAHFNVRRRTELIVLLAGANMVFGAPPVSDPTLDHSARP